MYMSFLCVFITPNNLYSEPLTIDLKVALLCEEQVSRVTRSPVTIEHLHGDKEGLSSVKINDQYRIEFREILEGDKTIAEMVSLTELSNHYKKT
jgi:plasmid maintenance system killer protein